MALCLSVSVSVSVTSRSSSEAAQRRNTLTVPHNSPGSLVFWSQKSPRNSTGVNPGGAPNAGGVGWNRRLTTNNSLYLNKKLSDRRGTARCVVSIEILPIATQQCRNYLYNKPWPNRWYEVEYALNHDATESAAIVSGVINKPTTVELCISPVYRRLALAKFSKSTM